MDIEIALAENRHAANETIMSIARLASDAMSNAEAAVAALNMDGISRTLRNRERERSREKFAKWITEMLDTSIGKLHRWAKGDDPTGGMSVQ